jgi:hypothetical protein
MFERSHALHSKNVYVYVSKHLYLGPVMNQTNQESGLLRYDAVLFGG